MLKQLLFVAAVATVPSTSFAETLSPITYQEALEQVANPSPEVAQSLKSTPKIYQFINENGDDSVGYVGQTFRQVLIHDLKLITGSLKRSEFKNSELTAYETLKSIYQYDLNGNVVSEKAINGDSRFLVKAGTSMDPRLPIYEGVYYSDIFPRTTNLQVKMAGVDNPLRKGELKGWNSPQLEDFTLDMDADGTITPAELVEAMMRTVAKNAAASSNTLSVPNGNLMAQEITSAAVTETGLDIAQMLQKFLHGAVSFSQGVGDYLSVDLGPTKGLNAENDRLFKKDDRERPFTLMQHHWDEAFGYFGAARNYLDYSDTEIRQKLSIDNFSGNTYVTEPKDQDGAISLEREKNFAMAVNAAKRDLGAPNGNIDFTATIYDAFIKGRHLIQDKPDGYLKQAQAYAVVASVEWEKVIAATVIHYINYTIKDIEAYGTVDYSFANLAKHYGELKGFALAFQFNPTSPMTDQEFETLHTLIKDAPVLPHKGDVTSYIADLKKARELVGKVYGFDKVNVEKW